MSNQSCIPPLKFEFRKWDILPKVEGFRAIPKDPATSVNPLYRTTASAYGKVSEKVFVLTEEQILFINSSNVSISHFQAYNTFVSSKEHILRNLLLVEFQPFV